VAKLVGYRGMYPHAHGKNTKKHFLALSANIQTKRKYDGKKHFINGGKRMNPINNWNNIEATGNKEYKPLPAGGYVAYITKVEDVPEKQYLRFEFDIVEGEYKGWFADDWKNQTREDKFWHGIIRQNIPDETSPKYDMQCGFFKRFTNAVEASNSGYHWDWNEVGLKGKLIGIVFGEVEKESKRGTRYMTTQPSEIVTVEAIEKDNYKVPAPKMLAPQYSAPAPQQLEEINSDDLPF
jgi:hypothetical protein